MTAEAITASIRPNTPEPHNNNTRQLSYSTVEKHLSFSSSLDGGGRDQSNFVFRGHRLDEGGDAAYHATPSHIKGTNIAKDDRVTNHIDDLSRYDKAHPLNEDPLKAPGTASTSNTTGTRSVTFSNTTGGTVGSSSFDSLHEISQKSSSDDYDGDEEINSAQTDNTEMEIQSAESCADERFESLDDKQREMELGDAVIIGEQESHHEDLPQQPNQHQQDQQQQQQQQQDQQQQNNNQQQQNQQQQQQNNNQQQQNQQQQNNNKNQQQNTEQEQQSPSPKPSQPVPQPPRTAPSKLSISRAKSFRIRRTPPRTPLRSPHSHGPRPSTAPSPSPSLSLSSLLRDTSSKYTSTPASLRSAQYLANQWRSRAVQWGTASKLNDDGRLLTKMSEMPKTSGRTIGSQSQSSGSLTESDDGEEKSVRMERLDVAKQVAKVWKKRKDYYNMTNTTLRHHKPDDEESSGSGSSTEDSMFDSTASSRKGVDGNPTGSVASAITNHSARTRKARGGNQRKSTRHRPNIADSYVFKNPASLSVESSSDSSVSSHDSDEAGGSIGCSSNTERDDMPFTQPTYSLESAYPLDPIISGIEAPEPCRTESSSSKLSLQPSITEEDAEQQQQASPQQREYIEIARTNSWSVSQAQTLNNNNKTVSFDNLFRKNLDELHWSNSFPLLPMPTDPPPSPLVDDDRVIEENAALQKEKEEAKCLQLEEEAKIRAEEEEAMRLRAEELARIKLLKEEEEAKRLQLEEEEAKIRAEKEEAMRLRVGETARLAAEEEEAARMQLQKEKEEEAERLQLEEEAKIRAEEEEIMRFRAEEAARIHLQKEEEEAERLQLEEEEANIKAEKEEAMRLQAEEVTRLQLQKEEAERLQLEEEAKIRAEEEEAMRLRAEEAARIQIQKEEEEAKRLQLEEAKIKAEEEEAMRLQAEEVARLQLQKEAERLQLEEEAKTRADEEETMRLRAEETARLAAEEEEAAHIQLLKEKEAERLQLEEEAKIKAEEEEVMRLQAEELARIKHLKEEEEEAERLQLEEAKIRAEKEEAMRLQAEESARLQLQKEEAERLQLEEEEAKIRADEEEAMRLRAEETARLAAEEEEAAHMQLQKEKEEAERLQLEEEAKIKAKEEEAMRLQTKAAGRLASKEEEAARIQLQKVEEEAKRLQQEEEGKIWTEDEEAMRLEEEVKINAEEGEATRLRAEEEVVEDAACLKVEENTRIGTAKTNADSHTSSSMNMSLRSFMSESTGTVPRSRCASESSSVGPEENCNNDFDLFSLQEEDRCHKVTAKKRGSLRQNDYNQAATTTKDIVALPFKDTPLTMKGTQTASHAHDIVPQSAITPTNVLRSSRKSSSSRRQYVYQSASTATIPLLPQHATIPVSTPATANTHYSSTNFGRKRYSDANICFSFSLLSSPIRAPQSGTYSPPKQDEDYNERKRPHASNKGNRMIRHTNSGILHKIMEKFSIAVRQTRMAGGILMEADCTAFPLSVRCDDTYTPPTKRPGLVRNLVRASIPIIYVKGDIDGLRSAKDSIRFTLRKAIVTGDFKGVR